MVTCEPCPEKWFQSFSPSVCLLPRTEHISCYLFIQSLLMMHILHSTNKIPADEESNWYNFPETMQSTSDFINETAMSDIYFI